MKQLKCPYCDYLTEGVLRLAPHVHTQHSIGNDLGTRLVAIRDARWVETVPVTSSALVEPTATAICICGNGITWNPDEQDWDHVDAFAAVLRAGDACTQALPAGAVPTQVDRKLLDDRLTEVNTGMAAAARDMAAIREALDETDHRMRELHARLLSPSTVRRATLNQVWDRLVDAGHLSAASIVMTMIKNVVDD